MRAGPASDPEICLFGAAVLRRRCREVEPGEDVGALAAALLAAMRRAGGVGLAAPQIGDPRRVLAASHPTHRDQAPLVMVNPRLEATFGPRVPFEEGCLSFPDLYLTLRRPRGVQVQYRDPDGRQQVLRDESLLARVVLHELDHLDGVLFVDHLARWRRWLFGWRLLRLRRQGARWVEGEA